MADEQDYNGWKNYATWCVNLWLGNEEGLYLETLAMVREGREDRRALESTYSLANRLRGYVEDLPEAAGVLETASFASDLLGAALAEVDWFTIAEHLIEDVSEDEASDERNDEYHDGDLGGLAEEQLAEVARLNAAWGIEPE